MQGVSFRKNLQNTTTANWRTDFYYRYWLHQGNRPAHFGIRNDRYKLAFYYGKPLGMPGADDEATAPAWEFFDLQNDPHEMHNAFADANYHTLIEEMKHRLFDLKDLVGDSDSEYSVMDSILTTFK